MKSPLAFYNSAMPIFVVFQNYVLHENVHLQWTLHYSAEKRNAFAWLKLHCVGMCHCRDQDCMLLMFL